MDPTSSFHHDPAHDILRGRRPVLDTMFSPKAIALIGATDAEGGVGRTILENLLANGLGSAVFPVNPKRSQVLGLPAFPGIADVPAKIDLAIIATPAPTVPGIVAECAAAGVAGAVVISAGFRETGAAGLELERRVLQAAREGRMRIVGPNCLGVMLPHAGLNATFAVNQARPGNVGFISQSGALCTAVLDWSLREHVGFSAFISIGSMVDVGWGDLIYWLGDDPHTHSIVLYMESVGNARAFLSAAREVALSKPIIVIKVGRTEQAARAAASHTGSLTGSDDVLDAAFRRVGVLRVDTIEELFGMAEVLGKQPRPRGPRLAIITNAGGPAALATDMLVRSGGKLAPLADESLRGFNTLLPPHWSHGNPIDLLGDSDPDRYAQAAEIVARDSNNDGLLAILTPQAMTQPTEVARRLAGLKIEGKPLLASWMGGDEVAEGNAILNRANIPTYEYPDAAARAFAAMWRHSQALDALYETPSLPISPERPDCRERMAKIMERASRARRTLLSEIESKRLLASYEIATVETRLACTAKEAVAIATEWRGPVVLKLHSETITHKSDAGGVKLDLHGASAVRRAFREIQRNVSGKDFLGVTVQPMMSHEGIELILGASVDPQFGPVLLFGAGGVFVEVFKDQAIGLPPLTTTLARRMMERTRVYSALTGVRGRAPVDLDALAGLLVRFSHIVAEHPRIREIEINPLWVSGSELLALDARVVLHGEEIRDEDLPRPAIRPYPEHYVSPWKLRDGTPVTLRPIRPEDEPLMIGFHRTLSEESVRFRYFGALKLEERVAHQRLRRICFTDYDRDIVLVAEHHQRDGNAILGVGRLSKLHGVDEAEFAIVVGDPWQGRGLGTRLLELLVEIGRKEQLSRLIGHLLPENEPMRRVARKAGFGLTFNRQAGQWEASIRL